MLVDRKLQVNFSRIARDSRPNATGFECLSCVEAAQQISSPSIAVTTAHHRRKGSVEKLLRPKNRYNDVTRQRKASERHFKHDIYLSMHRLQPRD